MTEYNYSEIRKFLRSRFVNKQVIIKSHIKPFTFLPTITSNVDNKLVTTNTNIKKTRELNDKIEINLRSLRNLGVERKMYGSLLVPIMKSKLQHELNLILHRRLDVNDVNEVNEVWKMSDMMEELNIDLEAPERIGDQIYKNK